MTNQSHTELAAQARKAAKALELLDMDDTAELLRQCAAALESPERVQGDEVATDPEDCTAWCPRCNGSGEETTLSDGGPDAHEVTINCRHCDGGGTLYAAYTGVVRELDMRRKAYLKACGDLYFSKHLPATPPPQAERVPLSEEERAKLLEAADHLSGDGHFMDASDADWAAEWLRGIVTKESSV